jgi:hypothetical protein
MLWIVGYTGHPDAIPIGRIASEMARQPGRFRQGSRIHE